MKSIFKFLFLSLVGVVSLFAGAPGTTGSPIVDIDNLHYGVGYSTVETNGSAYGAAVSNDGTKAYVVNVDKMVVLDLTADTPKVLTTYDVDGYPIAITLSADNTKAYIVNGNGLVVLDISSSTPALLGSYDTDGYAYTLALSKDGKRAYIADSSKGLIVLDITQNTPTLVGTYDTNGSALGVTLSSDGTTAYVADGSDGLVVLDITTNNPTFKSSYDTNGTAIDVKLSKDGNRAYVADSDGGLLVFDLNSSSPELLDSYVSGGKARNVTLTPDETKAYVSDDTKGLVVIDISKNQLIFLGSYMISSPGQVNFSVDGTKVYIVNGAQGLAVLDLNRSRFRVLGTYNGGEGFLDYVLSKDGQKAFVSYFSGYGILNLIGDAPSFVKQFSTDEYYSTALALSKDGTKLYMSLESDLNILDTTTDDLNKTGTYTAGNWIEHIILSNDETKVYLALWDGIEILDISSEVPEKIGSFDANGSIQDMVLSPDGTKAYIASYDDGLVIFDLSTDTPSLINTYSEQGNITDVKISKDGTRLYVVSDFGEGTGGSIIILDISTDEASLLDSYDIEGSISEIHISNDETQLYAADYSGGILIFDITNDVFNLLDTYSNVFAQRLLLSSDNTKAYVVNSQGKFTILDMIPDLYLAKNFGDANISFAIQDGDNSDVTLHLDLNDTGFIKIATTDMNLTSDDYIEKTILIPIQSVNDKTGILRVDMNVSDGTSDTLKPFNIVIPSIGENANVVVNNAPIVEVYNLDYGLKYAFVDTNASANSIALSKDGTKAYVANDTYGFGILDITQETPRWIASFDTNATARDVAISADGTRAYVADEADGLLVLDISTDTPKLLASYDTQGNAYGVTLSNDGTKAYVADEVYGVLVLDISTDTPTLLGSYDTQGYAYDITLSQDGTKAYVADGMDGITVLNIESNTPLFLGSFDTNGTAKEVVLSQDGTKAYVADYSGVLVLDITNDTPKFVGYFATNGYATGVTLSNDGTQLYVMDGTQGLLVLDVTTDNPQYIATYKTTGDAYKSVLSKDGKKLYMAQQYDGVAVLDIPSYLKYKQKSLLGFYSMNSWADGIALSAGGAKVYVAAKESGLLVLDTTKDVPKLLGSYDTQGTASDVVLSKDNTKAYIADGYQGLLVVDITTNTPTLLASYDTSGYANAVKLSKDGTKAYVADYGNGLVVLDITSDNNLTLIGSYDTQGNARAIALSQDDSKAYIADGNNGLVILDITNDTPTLLGTFNSNMGGTLKDVVLSKDGSKAYVADWSDGLLILDITGTNPSLITSYKVPYYVESVTLSSDGTKLYVGDSNKGMFLLDVSNTTPLLLGLYPEIAGINAISITEDGLKTYIAARAGVSVLDITPKLYFNKNFGDANISLAIQNVTQSDVSLHIEESKSLVNFPVEDMNLTSNEYNDKNISIALNSIQDRVGVTKASVSVSDGQNTTIKSFGVVVYGDALNLDLSNLVLDDKNISKIEYIGQNGNNESFIIANTQTLHDGNNSFSAPLTQIYGDYTIKITLADGSVWWYNFANHKLYNELLYDNNFIQTATLGINNVAIDASGANWQDILQTKPSADIQKLQYGLKFSQDINVSAITMALSKDGRRAYVVSDNDAISVYDMSVEKPNLIGSYELSTNASDIVLSADGTKAYVADYDYGFIVLDISSDTPTLLSTYDTNITAEKIALSSDGNKAYISGGYKGFYVLDISSNTPVLLSSYETNTSVSNESIENIILSKDGLKAYVAANESGLLTFDISQDTPVLVSSFDAGGFVKELVLSEDGTVGYLAVASGVSETDGEVQKYSGLEILDMNGTTPVLLDSFAARGEVYGLKLSNSTNKLWLRELYEGVRIVDINTNTPRMVGFFKAPSSSANDEILDIVFDNNCLKSYIITDKSGILGLNLQKNRFRNLASYPLESVGARLALSKDETKAYIAAGKQGLRVLNLNSATPTLLGYYDQNKTYTDIILSADETKAYVSSLYEGFLIFDITTSSPSLLASYDTQGSSEGIAISGDETKGYIADGSDGLIVLDITGSTPTLLGSYDTRGIAYNVTISKDGAKVYVADGQDGLLVLDITGNSPVLLGSYDTQGHAYDVTLSKDGTKAYVADQAKGVVILDITADTPRLLSGFDTDEYAIDIALSEDESKVYVADGADGLVVLDIKGNAPKLLGKYAANGHAMGVVLSKDETKAYTTGVSFEVIDIVPDIYLPQSFGDANITLHLDDARKSNLVLHFDLNDTGLLDIQPIDSSFSYNKYNDRNISVALSSLNEATGIARVDLNLSNTSDSIIIPFNIVIGRDNVTPQPVENNTTLNIDLSNVSLEDKNITSIEFIGKNGNNETVTIATGNSLHDGNSSFSITLSQTAGDYAIKVTLADGSVWWYNFVNQKLYNAFLNNQSFIETLGDGVNVLSLDAGNKNWVDTTSSPIKISKIFSQFLQKNSNGTSVSFKIEDVLEENLTVSVVKLSNNGVATASISHTNPISYNDYSVNNITMTIVPNADAVGYEDFEVRVQNSNGTSVSEYFNVMVQPRQFYTISAKESIDTFNGISAKDVSGDFYSLNTYFDYNGTAGVEVLNSERHSVLHSKGVKDYRVEDRGGIVSYEEQLSPVVNQSLKFATVLDAYETSSLYAQAGMPFSFSSPAESRKVFVKYNTNSLSVDTDEGEDATSLEAFMIAQTGNENGYGLLRSVDETKILTIAKEQLAQNSGTLQEYSQNGDLLDNDAGNWSKITVGSYRVLVIDPKSSEFRQESAFAFANGKVKHADYQRAGEVYSYVVLNKEAKNQLYRLFSTNPRIEIPLNHGYTYITLPSEKALCDEDVQQNFSICDKNNTLESVFGSNSDVDLVLTYGENWNYWNKEIAPNAAYTIPKFSVLNPLDGVLVKTSAKTSVYVPFDEDSQSVNSFTNLFEKGWTLVTNHKEQRVEDIASALQAQGKTLVYILVLRDDVWYIYAPTNDAEITTDIPRITKVYRYENYWVYFR